MSTDDYPSDVHFAGLVQAATAAAGLDGPPDGLSTSAVTPEPGRPSTSRKRPRVSRLSEGSEQSTKAASDVTRDPVAAALWRAPSSRSKRHTRPPVSTLYSSLELSPENFLGLQAAAKAFMLDDDYPDRRDCVSQRGRGENTDMVKLKLWNCATDFLDHFGNGAKYFGHERDTPESPSPPTLFWPEDRHKITKLCVPLLRRMVTNEKQRQYALETRKGGHNKDYNAEEHAEIAAGSLAASQKLSGPASQGLARQPGIAAQDHMPTGVATIPYLHPPAPPASGSLILHINVVSKDTTGGASNGKRVLPRFSLQPELATNIARLISEVETRCHAVAPNLARGSAGDGFRVKVWLPDGLVQVQDDGQWMVALLSAGMVEWMDGEVRVLVEV